MRSLALIALGSFIASTGLMGQSLAEHAATVAGASIGTAVGKPLGTALGKIFSDVDNSTSKAADPKVVKPAQPKVEAGRPALAPAPSGASGGTGASGGASGASASASTRHAARRRESTAAAESFASSPILAPITAFAVEPAVKEPSVEEIAAVKVGATSNELQTTLGAPESRVSIPDDDGHMLEICQYWANGQPLATIRLDNGRVVSVQTRSY
jgi:hypothetical protein